MAVSDSAGGVSLIKKGEHSFGVSNHKDNVHEYEVWSVCWDCKNNDILYTGKASFCAPFEKTDF